jgi:hypothetical protein
MLLKKKLQQQYLHGLRFLYKKNNTSMPHSHQYFSSIVAVSFTGKENKITVRNNPAISKS